MNINLELEEIILLLNENKFVEAHDVFEELWRVYKKDEATREESFILKAFVNASVYIELYKMQRFRRTIFLFFWCFKRIYHRKSLWNSMFEK